MRKSGADHQACLSLVTSEAPPTEEVTTAVSVATIRRLAARSAEDRAEGSIAAPNPVLAAPRSSVPSFFEKSGALLVISEAKSRTLPEPGEVPRGPDPETAGAEPARPSEVTPTKSAFRPKAVALLSDAERRRRGHRPSGRSFLGRLLTVVVYALLALVLGGALWVRNVGGVRERAAAAAPAVKALLVWGRALLPE
jgi:hypothetical protein